MERRGEVRVHVSAASTSTKRRWRGLASAVLALVFFSLLLPIVFLLGVHSRFPASGNLMDDGSSQDLVPVGYDGGDNGDNSSGIKGGIADGRVRKIGRTLLPKVLLNTTVDITKDAVSRNYSRQVKDPQLDTGRENDSSHLKDDVAGIPSPQRHLPKPIPYSLLDKDGIFEMTEQGLSDDEANNPCELEFGSYCIWSAEHKEDMEVSILKRLKDQLYVARAYYPSIAKLKSQAKLSHRMKQTIQEHERILSMAVTDADLPLSVGSEMKKMEATISKARSLKIDCFNVDRKLRQILDLSEDEARFHRRQSAFLYHLNVETTPKTLHCLSMRLTVEYFRNSQTKKEIRNAEKFESRSFHHYVIFSKNVLAASVTINSTVMNAKESENLVFHLLTDRQNYFAMRVWFSRNLYREASVEILNIEDLDINKPQNSGLPFSLSEEFRISVRDTIQPSQIRTEYTSVFGHSHFLLPDIFRKLDKVIILEDDIIVQRDLISLWSLNLQGRVIGVVQQCNVRLHQLKGYLGNDGYGGDSCTWMSGLNIVDLEKWREHGISEKYLKLIRKVKSWDETSWRAATLPISFLAFRDLTFPLEDTWMFSGLGNNHHASVDKIEKSAVLHYNGNMKPWLELGIPKYKSYWRKFLLRGNPWMEECNINP